MNSRQPQTCTSNGRCTPRVDFVESPILPDDNGDQPRYKKDDHDTKADNFKIQVGKPTPEWIDAIEFASDYLKQLKGADCQCDKNGDYSYRQIVVHLPKRVKESPTISYQHRNPIRRGGRRPRNLEPASYYLPITSTLVACKNR